MVYAAPKARMACREARAASAEIGGFEFGLYGTKRRGYWLNHTSDIVKITTDLLAHPYFHSVDLSRIQRLAFGQAQFKSEPNAAGILELILTTCRSCREIVMLYDQDSRFTYRHPSTLTRTNIQVLKEDDIIGNHAFPPSRNLPDGPITWGELHGTVMDVWEEYMIERRLDIARIPRLNGMDLIRSARMF
ncbi:hypothetical protein F5X68DRAFT_202105 [Plectosphaerella plurivora]|uniref:Uncharacterized protein n=1 Tax=Plectosphaerella plurivora TaxID=936078 RepID=A0A9P8VGF5_9PEZI|nr:hypothetical protein F5X68DRAFT_202105 [Plectosphaerella plurivora]